MRVFGGRRGPILVAGSTWPSDEDVLLTALARVREVVPGLNLLWAPHEPDGYDFAGLGKRLAALGWTPGLLGAIEGGASADAVLVDRVGVLADLYGLATVAYVGGGFHDGGLHSVLEPAAVAVPVLIGPRHHGSIHAQRLLAAGAARSVSDADGLARALEEWLQAPNKNDDPGQHARDYIEDHRGSAERAADLITQFLPR